MKVKKLELENVMSAKKGLINLRKRFVWLLKSQDEKQLVPTRGQQMSLITCRKITEERGICLKRF